MGAGKRVQGRHRARWLAPALLPFVVVAACGEFDAAPNGVPAFELDASEDDGASTPVADAQAPPAVVDAPCDPDEVADAERGVFVDTNVGSDEGTGSALSPFKTVRHALEEAARLGKDSLYLSIGVYTEASSLRLGGDHGVRLLGGWKVSAGGWSRECAPARRALTELRIGAAIGLLAAESVTDDAGTVQPSAVELRAMTVVVAPMAGEAAGTSTVAVSLAEAHASWRLEDVTLVVDRGIDGADGSAGADGVAGGASSTCANGASAQAAAPGAAVPGSYSHTGFVASYGEPGLDAASGESGTAPPLPACAEYLVGCSPVFTVACDLRQQRCGGTGSCGGGGQGGSGGSGGQAGGASLGVFASGDAARVVLDHVHVTTAGGGDGGAGGQGGQGGQGAAGQPGDPATFHEYDQCDRVTFPNPRCMPVGGTTVTLVGGPAGGAGGRGGDGGQGAAGAGGDSMGVVLVEGATQESTAVSYDLGPAGAGASTGRRESVLIL